MRYIKTKRGSIIDISKYDEVDVNAKNDIILISYDRNEYLIIDEEDIYEIH